MIFVMGHKINKIQYSHCWEKNHNLFTLLSYQVRNNWQWAVEL